MYPILTSAAVNAVAVGLASHADVSVTEAGRKMALAENAALKRAVSIDPVIPVT